MYNDQLNSAYRQYLENIEQNGTLSPLLLDMGLWCQQKIWGHFLLSFTFSTNVISLIFGFKLQAVKPRLATGHSLNL